MIKGFLRERYSNKSFSAVIEEFFESAVFGFGILMLYSIYRTSRGYALDQLSSAVTAGYLKFLWFFLFLTLAAYFIFCVLMNRRKWLDALLGITWASVLIGFIAFSVGTVYAVEARITALIACVFLSHFLFNIREPGPKFSLGNQAAAISLLAAIAVIFFSDFDD